MEIEQEDEKEKERKKEAEETIIPSFSFFDKITNCHSDINKIKFSSDNKYLLSGGNDCQVNIVDLNSQNLLRNFRLESIVTSLDINYANNILAVGTYDYLMYLFDIRTRNCICKMICHSEPITDVKFSEDSTVIYSTSYDSFFRIWDMFRFSPLKTFSLENSPSINNTSVSVSYSVIYPFFSPFK